MSGLSHVLGARAGERPGLTVLPKLTGFDAELAAFIRGRPSVDALEACHRLQAEMPGRPATAVVNGRLNPQDVARKFLYNGSSSYIDLGHPEICGAETLSAFDHVAVWEADLRLVQRARRLANAKLPSDESIELLANNSDGRGHAWGNHRNFLITPHEFLRIAGPCPDHLPVVASFLASMIPITGTGKLGAENGAPPAEFQLSQRADHFETLKAEQTTWSRPLVNARDEPLANGDLYARLHVIFFDTPLCHVATLLQVGVTQLVLAMLESGWLDGQLAGLSLLNPVRTLAQWSRDLEQCRTARLQSGARVTAIDLQYRFFEHACRFVATGRAEEIVPDATRIMRHWEQVLTLLEQENHDGLVGKLDWATKLWLLERARRLRGWNLDSPGARQVAHMYHSLDEARGLFWQLRRDGAVQEVVTEQMVAEFVDRPPRDTRAYARVKLLRDPNIHIEDMDWDWITYVVTTRTERVRRHVRLGNPLDPDPGIFGRPPRRRRYRTAHKHRGLATLRR